MQSATGLFSRISNLMYLVCLGLVLTVGSLANAAQPESRPVLLGIDVLEQQNFAPLAGKRIGLIAHPASVNASLRRTVDVLRAAPNVQLVALFGPEHGVYGDVYAGDKIADATDPNTGLPVFSLYGKTRKPTPEMLANVDALVFDLQDIGSRSYTFISTMKVVMQACAENNKQLIILDRPNPLGGLRVEGPDLQKPFESFIGLLYVPYLHGLTMGELARYVQATEHPSYTGLNVIPMHGWKRSMLWPDTGLQWVPTSPHIPNFETAVGYAATGFIGELQVLSNGVGYPQPFLVVGAPNVNGDALAEALNRSYSSPYGVYKQLSTTHSASASTLPAGSDSGVIFLETSAPGVFFRPIRFRPFFSKFKEEVCQGVQVHIDARSAENIVEINFRILQALGSADLFAKTTPARNSMFDKAAGSDAMRNLLAQGQDPAPLFQTWREQCQAFIQSRKPYLLYE